MRLLRKLCLVTVAAAVLGVPTGRSMAAILTFDGQPTGPFMTLTESGFVLNFIGFGDLQAVADLGGGNKALIDSNPNNVSGAEVIITHSDGLPFNLESLDIANLDNPGGGPIIVGGGSGFRIELIGGGNSISYTTGSSTFSTISPSGFDNITALRLNIVSLSASGLSFAVDNINVTAVPEPSSLVSAAVGASLLFGFCWRSRQRKMRLV